jgi:hypothetical protein
MKIKTLIILAFLLTEFAIKAQTDYRVGYVILNSGDTLFGEIDYRGDLLMSSICKFKSDDIEKTYYPFEILGFRFIDSKYYISREVNIADFGSTKVFLEYLIKGQVSIYYFRDENGDHYFIEKPGYGLVELPYKEEIRYKENSYTTYFYHSTKHIGILNYFLSDAPDFKSSIEAIKTPNHKDLSKLTEKYQKKVCKNEPCIIYEKKISYIRLSLEPLVGFSKYKKSYFDFQNVNEYGANIFLWMPRGNEKLYFKTGFIYGVSDTLNFFKFPLQFQYLYPHGRFRPKLCIGTSFYTVNYSEQKNYFNLLYLGSGFIYKIYKTVYLSTNINSEFTPIWGVIFPGEDMKFDILSYSFSFGFYIEL